jgi:hypothetical protein
MRIIAWTLAFVVAAATQAVAQVQTLAVPIAPPFPTTHTIATLGTLTATYNSGDWNALLAFGKDVIGAARNAATVLEASAPDVDKPKWRAVLNALDTSKRYVVLTWIGDDAFGTPGLKRFIAHDPSLRPFAADLPGVSSSATDSELVELFLSRSASAKAVSLYTSTRQQDPIEAALPAFIQAIAAPLFATVGAVAGTRQADPEPDQPPPPPPPLIVTVKHVPLPFSRAAVRLQAIAKDPLSRAELTEAVTNHALSVKFTDVPYSVCARAHVDKLAVIVRNVASENSCSGTPSNPEQCRTRFTEEMAKAYDATAADCNGGTPTGTDLTAIQLADRRFRTFVDSGLTSTAELDTTFFNRPLTHFALGAGSGVIALGGLNRARVQLEDNVIVADPLDRVMTMAFVNWSPAGYDTESARIGWSERARLFVGAGITPDFGVVAGLNTLIVRGIGVTIGGAFLFGKGAPDEQIGKPPVVSTDPFELGVTKALFIGISYSYK